MSKNSAVPDAWDDDWETLADKHDPTLDEPKQPQKITKSELKARHAEANRQLWESAETPTEEPLFVQTKAAQVPLKTDFKPAVTVLSRKPPPPKVLSRGEPSDKLAGLQIEDDYDSEEEERRRSEAAFRERQAKAQREREEKQRKYAEVRERLFGSSAPAADAPKERSASPRSDASGRSRGKGRGRGGSHANSSADQSPARGPTPKRLYDPSYTAKPNSVYLQRRDAEKLSQPATPNEDQPVRSPRGPDGSGRGGFGFAPRGGRIPK